MRRVIPLLLGLWLVPPASAMLLEATPERVVFMGYPTGAPDLTIKIVRRAKSYGIYAFRTGTTSGRVLSSDRFVGMVEGSLEGVGLDSRGSALLESWRKHYPRTPKPTRIGSYYRYYFEAEGWVLSFTLRAPYLPSEARKIPVGIVSQLYASKQEAGRLESLSRDMDLEKLQLKDGRGLNRLTR